MNTTIEPDAVSKSKSVSKPTSSESTQSPRSDDSQAQRRPFASTPLVVSLLILLIAAVFLQGAIFLTLYLREKKDSPGSAGSTAAATATAPALVPKSDNATTAPNNNASPASPLPSVPFGSGLMNDFFSDDWQPFAELARMREEMDRVFQHSFDRFGSMPGFDDNWLNAGTAFSGDASITEKNGNYVVTLEVPGADEATLDINVENNILTVQGKREELDEQKDSSGNVIRRSSSSSSFQRSYSLPGEANAAEMSSSYKDGVLTITIPKADK